VVIFSFLLIFFFVLILFKKAYFLSGKHPAALCAAATGREIVPLYFEARTFFKKSYGNSTIEPTEPVTSDRSADMPPPGWWPPAVLPPAMTSVDQPKQEPKLNPNQGVIYRASQAG